MDTLGLLSLVAGQLIVPGRAPSRDITNIKWRSHVIANDSEVCYEICRRISDAKAGGPDDLVVALDGKIPEVVQEAPYVTKSASRFYTLYQPSTLII